MTAFTSAKCYGRCKGERPCGCNGSIPHTMHICRDPDGKCICHEPQGYGLELAHDRNGEPYFVKAGTRLIVRKVQR